MQASFAVMALSNKITRIAPDGLLLITGGRTGAVHATGRLAHSRAERMNAAKLQRCSSCSLRMNLLRAIFGVVFPALALERRGVTSIFLESAMCKS